MRPLGLIVAAVLAAPAARAQAPAGPQPGAPGGAPPAAPAAQPPAPAAADPQLDAHLAAWEKQMRGLVNFRAEFTLTRKEAVFQKARDYSGVVLCMKPNLAILRLDNVADKKDYEAYICNGQAVYEYSGLNQTIVEIPLPAGAAAGTSDNLMLDFLSGMTAQAVKQRFQIALFVPNPAKPDPNYVYLDIKPLQQKDRQEFEHVRFALFGPNVPRPYTAYMPASVYLLKPNGDTELWKFTKVEKNLPGVDAKAFVPKKVDGFQFKKAPMPGQPAPPAGSGPAPGAGAVRPGTGRP